MTPRIIKQDIPHIIKTVRQLSTSGKLAVSSNRLIYLDIDDNYIHQAFPLLQNKAINKPNYFGEKSAGAHVSVIYPEEKQMIDKSDLNKEHEFIIKNLVAAEIGHKIYYAILVESPSLLQLRRKYGLPNLLNFKGYLIGFHITIGYSN